MVAKPKQTKLPSKAAQKLDAQLTLERRSQGERRATRGTPTVQEERRQPERRKVPRRRQIDPTTCERDYTGDEIEFMQAMDAYKRASGRMFPTCSEVLEVIRNLGYVKQPLPAAPITISVPLDTLVATR